MQVSTLILTFNEARNIGACLDGLAWCDDIVVLDSGSTDETVEIARARGARILNRPFDNFAQQRNYGLDHGDFLHEQVLHLDADEVLTISFIEKLAALKATPGINGYRVPSKTMLMGRWLRRAGMYPAYQVRLGHRDRLRFKQVGHGQREDLAPENIGLFDEPYLHFNFSHGLKNWLEKHVRYAAAEAAELLAHRSSWRSIGQGLTAGGPQSWRALKALFNRMPLFARPVIRFIYIYGIRGGFLEGRAGLLYALMISTYEGMIAILAYEQLLTPRKN